MGTSGGVSGYTQTQSDSRFYGPSLPADHGYLSWSTPIYAAQLTSLMSVEAAAGTLRLSRNRRVAAGPVTNLVTYVTTAGSGLTSGQCFGALYDASGNLLGSTADQSVAWASGGLKSMALAGGPVTVPAGDYYVGLWYNGTTAPTLLRAGLGIAPSQINANQSAGNYDVAFANTGLTTTAPNPFGATTAGSLLWWTALS